MRPSVLDEPFRISVVGIARPQESKSARIEEDFSSSGVRYVCFDTELAAVLLSENGTRHGH